MKDPMTTEVKTDTKGRYTLTRSKAKVRLTILGDEAAKVELSGKASLRDWGLLGMRLSGIAQKVGGGEFWGDAVENDDAPMSCSWGFGDCYRVKSHGGVTIHIPDPEDLSDEQEAELTVRGGPMGIAFKAESDVGLPQLDVIGALITETCTRLIRKPLGLFSLDELRETIQAILGGER